RSNSLALIALGTGLAVAMTACGANSSGGGSAPGSTAGGGPAGGAKVGVILPETATSARWESFDKP
ncbi:sugar ABC transporter substrate-binding protein, partial [Saccharothrix algeriensis]